MLNKINWAEDRSYRTSSGDEPIQFYLDGLCNSNKFDLLLGYFSSAAINVLSLGFATFLYNGGKVRLIVNNILSQEDRDAINAAKTEEVKNSVIDLSDIRLLRATLDEYGQHFFSCLSWLIANDKIQIKIIKPLGGKGIAHYKSGIFSDGNNDVGFKASCNFTAFGLLENLEELDAFLSWENSRSSKMIKRQKDYFEMIFSEKADFVEYLNADAVTIALKEEFGGMSENELVVHEKELIEKKKLILNNPKTKKRYEEATNMIDEIINEPRFPYNKGPRQFQIDACQRWIENGYKGIFAMATGTGKTITSLNCLLRNYPKDAYKAIILVPTVALLEQWRKECRKFKFKNVITISVKENWQQKLSFLNTLNRLINTQYIIIVTYASFCKPKFQAYFKQFPKEALLIADEVHNMGSPRVAKLLTQVHLKPRIGLSATPSRNFDVEGNIAISEFFQDKAPYVFSFSMKEALDNGWLCRYKYFPHVVFLTEEELKRYTLISKQLLKYLDPKTGNYRKCKESDILLISRKRIIHKAEHKKERFEKIVTQEFTERGNLKYTLVYAPEGAEADYSRTDSYVEDDEDLNLVDHYTRLVREVDDSVMVQQYTSKTMNREAIIDDFEKGKVHVLISMKCLDEGVDIPRSELAIFCASTGNPRQFIQRRGRVLRLNDEKIHATIHDLVVVPQINVEETNFSMERNLLIKELERVVDFSELSMNKIDTFERLEEVLKYYNINLNDLRSK